MTMNIVMQICGILVVLFLLVLYQSHKTLHLPSEMVFRVFMVIVFVCLSLDALSVAAIHFGMLGTIPKWLMICICKAYLISMISVGWINFVYVSLDLNSTQKKHKRAAMIMLFVTVLESIAVSMLPINAVKKENAVYTEGLAVYATYVFTIFYILSTLSVAIYLGKKKNARRAFAVIITTCLWIIAAAIQIFNNELLLVGFSMAIGTMILYVVMENPDANLNKRLGCFNSYAFYEYINMRCETKKDFCLLDVSITDIRKIEERGIDVNIIAQNVIKRLSLYHQAFVFKNDLANIVIVSNDMNLIKHVTIDIQSVMTENSLSNADVTVFTLERANRLDGTDELLKFMTYVRGNVSLHNNNDVTNVSDEMIAEYRNLGVIEKEIDDALNEDRVEVFLQPIYSNVDEKVISAEALVRIRKYDGELLSPGLFIPVAEITGQVKALGERVLEKVCGFLKESAAVDMGLKCVDVNLSAVQCDDCKMAGTLCAIVEKYGVDSRLINFEITETAVSSAKETLLSNMNELVSKGFSFALDDFGKGESNLIYIVTMPVKFIKLDIDMSKAYFENPKAKHVVASITDMANKLGLQIVAEGIETEQEACGITAEGIQYIQGYFYSKPLPFGEFIEYMEKNR